MVLYMFAQLEWRMVAWRNNEITRIFKFLPDVHNTDWNKHQKEFDLNRSFATSGHVTYDLGTL